MNKLKCSGLKVIFQIDKTEWSIKYLSPSVKDSHCLTARPVLRIALAHTNSYWVLLVSKFEISDF